MPISLPPGIAYLLQNLPSIVIPPATVAALGQIARNHTDVNISPWIIALACVLSLPVAFAVKVLYKDWKNEKDAAAQNAFLPPRVPDSLPAGLGLLRGALNSFKNGYPGMVLPSSRFHLELTITFFYQGEQFEGFYEQLGSHFMNFRILYEDRVITFRRPSQFLCTESKI